MMRYSIICALLCTALSGVQSVEHMNAYHTAGEQAATVFMHEHRFDIFKSDRESSSFLKIMSTHNKHKVCSLPTKHATESTTGGIQAAALDNEKIIIWGRHGLNVDHEKKVTTLFYVFFIVDPFTCDNYTTLPYFTDDLPLHSGIILPTVIPYKNTFDVFLPSQQNCNPCRFDDRGEQQELHHTIPVVEGTNLEKNRIQAYLDSEHEVHGYIATYNFKDQTLMKIFHNNFALFQQKRLNYEVTHLATNYGARMQTVLCSVTTTYIPEKDETATELYCTTLDYKFDKDQEITLPIHNERNTAADVKITMTGNVYITTVEEMDDNAHEGVKMIQVQVHKYNGDSGEKIDSTSKSYPAYYKVESFLTDSHKLYCVIRYNDPSDPAGRSIIHTLVNKVHF